MNIGGVILAGGKPMAAGLIDEHALAILSVLVGSGMPMFTAGGSGRT